MMMRYLHEMMEPALSVAIALLGGVLFWRTFHVTALWREPLGPAAYPRMVSVVLVGAATILFARSCWAIVQRRRGNPPAETEQAGGREEGDAQDRTPKAVILLALMAPAYLLAVLGLGYYTATFAFLFSSSIAMMAFARTASWLKTFFQCGLFALAFVTVLYFATHALKIYVPPVGVFF